MAKKTHFEVETLREIAEDSGKGHKIKIKRKDGGSAKGGTSMRRMDQRSRSAPLRPGMGGVASGMPAADPGSVMPTRVMPRPVGAAVPAALGAGTTPRGFRDGGRTRQQVGGKAGGKYPERVTRPWGVEDEDRQDRSSGRYVPEDKVPRDDYADGGSSHWIKGAIKHPGALHRELGIPEGQKIPASKIEKATHSDNPTLRRRANLAQTLKKMH